MIVDTSQSQARSRSVRRISAANFVEVALVIDGSRDPIASRRFDDFFKEARIAVEPVTLEQARLAREAYRDFGNESGHPAKLNFGDCFAYALAKATGEPFSSRAMISSTPILRRRWADFGVDFVNEDGSGPRVHLRRSHS